MLVLPSEETVASADVSADGRYAVTADLAQVVRIWKLDSPGAPYRVLKLAGAGGQQERTKYGYDNPVALSADGALVACAPAFVTEGSSDPGEKEVHFVSTETGEIVRRISLSDRPRALRFLTDGTLLVALPRAGIHLHPPDGSAPTLLSGKTVSSYHLAGADAQLLIEETTAKWRLIARSGKPKPKAVKAWFVDHNDDLLVFADYKKPSLHGERGKEKLEATLPNPAIALAADSERVAVVTTSEVLVFSAKDLSHQGTYPGNYTGVGKARLRSGKLVLWTLSQLREARPSATLLDLTVPASASTAPAVLSHRSAIVEVMFLGDEVVSLDKDGLLLGWKDGAAHAIEPASLTPALKLRSGVEKSGTQLPSDAVQMGDRTLVSTSGGALRLGVGEGFTSLAAPALGVLHQKLQAVDASRAIAFGNETLALIDVSAGKVLSRTEGGDAVAVSSDGNFVARLSGSKYLHLHPLWNLSLSEQQTKLREDGKVVDLALGVDDVIILGREEGELRVVDPVTLVDLTRVKLDKKLRRIGTSPSRPGRVAVAFADGTAAEVTIPAFESSKDASAALDARWNPELSRGVREDLERLGFERHERSPEVETPAGALRVSRPLHELLSWRTRSPLHGNSPQVWADVPEVEFFYKAIFKEKKTPRGEKLIDLGGIRFDGSAEPYRDPRGPKSVASTKGALGDPRPMIRVATHGDGEVIWAIAANTFAPDPYVTFIHLPTGISESIAPISELLYRLVPDLTARKAEGS